MSASPRSSVTLTRVSKPRRPGCWDRVRQLPGEGRKHDHGHATAALRPGLHCRMLLAAEEDVRSLLVN